MLIPLIILAIIVGGALYIISTYNGLQTLKTQIVASIQEIGNQLKRQSSLIPNLEVSVKAYMGHEQGIFQMLTDARMSVAQADRTGKASDIDQAADKVQAFASHFSVMVESNPELKANATITKFMDELTDTSDKLMYARRSLIDLSQTYNQRLVTFPGNMIAQTFGFKPEKGLDIPMTGSHVEVSAAEMQDVQVKL